MSFMDVYITDESARSYWETVELSGGLMQRSSATSLVGAAAAEKDLKGRNIPREALVDRKLHVLVGGESDRRHSKHVVSHICTASLPRGSFCRVSDSVLVVSPELLFVQMARKLPIAETIRLGYELCGTYVVRPSDPERNHREPLTTVDRIQQYIEKAGAMKGCCKALRALEHVVPNSNSPMETVLAMLLCLPNRYGGYGIPKPQMNYEVKLGRVQARKTGHIKFKCDLYWKFAAYALEYYGRDWHTGVQQVAHDAWRQGELQYRGIDVTVVTYEQVDTPEHVEMLARKVAKRLGVRIRKPGETCVEARKELHARLLAA